MAEEARIKVETESRDPRTLTILEKNARFMRHEQFQTLVENVKRDGCLTSTPFVWVDTEGADGPPGREYVLSGNHRVQAACDAGLEEITVLVCREPLTREKRVAIQLSHNAISGEDDDAVLKQLFEELTSVDMRLYSGIDDIQMNMLDEVDVDSISELNLEFRTLHFTFLPHETAAVEQVFAKAQAEAARCDEMYAVSMDDHRRLLEALDFVETHEGVRNRAAGLRVILDMWDRHKEELIKNDGEEEDGAGGDTG